MSINPDVAWWKAMSPNAESRPVDGLILVAPYKASRATAPEEVIVMERARQYGAMAVFFSAPQAGKAPTAQAFVYDERLSDGEFAALHKKLWSWGGVPLVYRRTAGSLQLFRCGHRPDFVDSGGRIRCHPVKTLQLAGQISDDPWWDASRLRNGTLWDDPATCDVLLSSTKSAHKALINAVQAVNEDLNREQILPRPLRRKLLILSLLIAYLEQREAFVEGYFSKFLPGSTRFFEVLAHGPALVALLGDLEARFNGNVFELSDEYRARLRDSGQLAKFSRLIEARQDRGGQLSLWDLYSFKDLPVELVSHIYQLFVKDEASSIYTPPHLVRLVLEEALSWDKLDELSKGDGVILDCACGSGVFLVEAYKRLVTHWRSRNDWQKPDVKTLRALLNRVHGIDLEEAAVELAAFSLCLALCDALEPEELRASVKLFPALIDKTLLHSCFFLAKESGLIKSQVFCIVGNPPFASELNTPASQRSYNNYRLEFGERIPDNQIAYLFLHEAMSLLEPEGTLAMLQQYNLLYNQGSLAFRRAFFRKWDVREVLDFVSVRGLFHRGKADTKVVVMVAEAREPTAGRQVLHATFRRTGRTEAEQGFDIDYYDLHWIAREAILEYDTVWRSNLLGGGRTHLLMERLKRYPSVADYADAHNWVHGEGFIEAKPSKRGTSPSTGKLVKASHLTGKALIPAAALTGNSLDHTALDVVETTLFKSAYTAARFTAPMVVMHQQLNLNHAFLPDGYYTYKNQIVGFCAPERDKKLVKALGDYLLSYKMVMQAFVAGTSIKLFTQHATTLSAADIQALPYPETQDLEISTNEAVVIQDIVLYYCDLIRFADKSAALTTAAHDHLPLYNERFLAQIRAIFRDRPINALPAQIWPGVICQPYAFMDSDVEWADAQSLKETVSKLLTDKRGQTIQVTRICRLYQDGVIFLLKPDRLRYWLPSIALRDADDVLADMRSAALH